MEQLTAAVTEAFHKVVASGTIEQAIEKNLTDTVNSLISAHLRSHSPFAKLLGERVSKALQVDFDRIDLPSYGDMILKIVQVKVAAHADEQLAKTVQDELGKLLVKAPEQITLTDLVAQFIEHNTDRYNGGEQHESITLIVEDTIYSGRWIHMDPEPDKDKYECAIRFLLSNQDQKISALRLDRKDVDKTIFVGPLYGFERSLFQMHTAGTKLVGADKYIDTSYPGRD